MPNLHITRGLPASGKTTHARVWVDADRANRVRVNRDDLRSMIDRGVFVEGITEGRIVAARDALIVSLLGRGLDVICDDTNLPQRTVRDLAKLAGRARAGFEVIDFTDVPLDECIKRDARRSDKRPVGELVIRGMHDRFLRGRVLPLPHPSDPVIDLADGLYEPKPGTPEAVIVDIDGTLALHGTRSPFDESRVHEDRPNLPVIEAIRQEASRRLVIFMSGRTEACREATVAWLCEHVGAGTELTQPHLFLFMRRVGDNRADVIVKRELFDLHVREHFNVRRVYDDRNQVVAGWRAIGLTVLQVADGDF